MTEADSTGRLLPKRCLKSQKGQMNTAEKRQDKSGSPVVIQAIDMACFPACLSVGARAALKGFANNFNAAFGTVRSKPRERYVHERGG